MKLKRSQFLPSIVTTKNDWPDKFKEADGLGLKKIALFPTCLGVEKRKAFYQLLDRSGIKEVPFAHIRGDMAPGELDYFIKKYQTKAFNVHTQRRYPIVYDYSRYFNKIYLENTFPLFEEEELKQFAGICLDFSHLENGKRFNRNNPEKLTRFLEKYPIGCNHISGIAEKPYCDQYSDNLPVYDLHRISNFSQFDYLKNYPLRYFSNFCAIELENSLKEQLAAIDYIVKLMS